MNRLTRIALIAFAFSISVMAMLFMIMLISDDVFNGMLLLLTSTYAQSSVRLIGILLTVIVLGLSVLVLVYAILSGRLRKTRIRTNDIGSIDIGVDAIESIALNSARSAQCGIKTAKARVAPFKGGQLSIQLNTVLYSDVEVPVMMAKVQDRIKKDIERYTGIPVADVQIKVSRVEAVSARVEH